MDACWRTRAYGDFWSYMLLAEGAVDLAGEPELSLWDVAALVASADKLPPDALDILKQPLFPPPPPSTPNTPAVGVPGRVRGLALAHQRFGKLPWKDVVAPAIKLAEDGFAIDNQLAAPMSIGMLLP